MLEITVRLRSLSAYSPSRAHETPRREKEAPDAWEKRTWLEKGHYDGDDKLYIPMMGFKQGLDTAAKFLSQQIPGKGKQTYTKHFLSGVLCSNNLSTGVAKNDCLCERIYANTDGVRGSGKRVWRLFPKIEKWEGDLTFVIVDMTITPEVFLETLEAAGRFVGVGRFRPERGGTNGRFEVVKWKVNELKQQRTAAQ